MIRAVIFDMDGLMFNTEVMFKAEFKEKLESKGIMYNETVVTSLIGCDSRMVERYESEYPGIQQAMKELQSERVDYFFRFFKEKGSADKKGLSELITYLEKNGIPYAIASSSALEHIRRFLEHASVEIHPTAIVSSKQKNIPSKPAPDIFIEAAKVLNTPCEECLVLEDGKYGIIAAKRAGIPSVFIRDQIQPDEEMEEAICYRRDSLLDIITMIEQDR